ncbi:hypothetical protein GGTG_04627 [Gaeumannomyces tritici R3-111a-1]|uniref:Uncharacterized protein n=1 Tax=Gaeumannomyces tritici (strain R3-111a-1) TaxID=644352 RepID=J3NTM7_GAET3|nr:hypothetical protein GGTG_04627 [Gaeumannomyces tritici R3-111a-1]EJT79542.1 hypothetical protein GGTG_04627 [Gaeumannomyces tritici R3-111a-1]
MLSAALDGGPLDAPARKERRMSGRLTMCTRRLLEAEFAVRARAYQAPLAVGGRGGANEGESKGTKESPEACGLKRRTKAKAFVPEESDQVCRRIRKNENAAAQPRPSVRGVFPLVVSVVERESWLRAKRKEKEKVVKVRLAQRCPLSEKASPGKLIWTCLPLIRYMLYMQHRVPNPSGGHHKQSEQRKEKKGARLNWQVCCQTRGIAQALIRCCCCYSTTKSFVHTCEHDIPKAFKHLKQLYLNNKNDVFSTKKKKFIKLN